MAARRSLTLVEYNSPVPNETDFGVNGPDAPGPTAESIGIDGKETHGKFCMAFNPKKP